VPLHQAKELPHLIRFCLPGDFLQIQQFRDRRMREDMVTSCDAHEPEAECADQTSDVVESRIVRGRQQLLQELPLAHVTSPPLQSTM